MRIFSKSSKIVPIIFHKPKEIYSDNICGICLEKIIISPIPLPCGHCFHSDCIIKWINKNMSCPHCRMKLEWYYKK